MKRNPNPGATARPCSRPRAQVAHAGCASSLMMRIQHEQPEHAGASMVEQLRQGWDYVSSSLPLRSILLLFALISLMGWPFMVLMPIFAGQVLHGGAHTFGFLVGA